MKRIRRLAAAVSLAVCGVETASGSVETVAFEYRVTPNIVYRSVGDWIGRVDAYVPAAPQEKPTLVWIHGGGWTRSSKEEEALYILPYLVKGWSVVAVEYRLAGDAPAPAAVEDCRCALAWLLANGSTYGIPTRRVVLSGISAGGHLALTTAGLVAPQANGCPLPPGFKPAAVVNWFGPTDLVELALAERPLNQAAEWIQGRRDVARAVSPVHHVSAGGAPILTIHGTADPAVPYSQSVRLHRALSASGVPNRLFTVEGAGHGDFDPQQIASAYEAVWTFIESHLTP